MGTVIRPKKKKGKKKAIWKGSMLDLIVWNRPTVDKILVSKLIRTDLVC